MQALNTQLDFSRWKTLTPRERQVAIDLAKGHPNAVVATRFHITPTTVGTHRGNALKKLGLRNNAELTRFALKFRIIDTDGNELPYAAPPPAADPPDTGSETA